MATYTPDPIGLKDTGATPINPAKEDGNLATTATAAGNMEATLASLAKVEDAAHTTGDVGVMALAVRNDTRSTLAGTNGDYAPLQLNSSGDLRVEVTGESNATAGTPAGITVSTSAVLLAASNANRRSIIITNNGMGNLFVGGSSGVTASGSAMGVLVKPGGSYSDAGYGLYTGDVYGIYDTVSSSQNVSRWERT